MPAPHSMRARSRSRRAITAFSTTSKHRTWPRWHAPTSSAATATMQGRLQTAANRALRIGLIEYDRRHGYRGPLKHLTVDDRTAPAKLDAALADIPEIGGLRPALVVSVAPMAARVYIRSVGFAQIEWGGRWC